jgi:hypothetical protein
VVSSHKGIVLGDQLERLPGTYIREGDRLLEIADPDRWQALLLLTEDGIPKVTTGQEVSLEIPALHFLDTKPLRGTVSSVAIEPIGNAAAKSESAPKLYKIHVIIDEVGIDPSIGLRIKRGYTVVGRIITDKDLIYRAAWNSFLKKGPSK